MSGINYKKWDQMQFSSDSEDDKDGHPNVDPKLLRRLKREKREREEAEEIERLIKKNDEASKQRLEQIKNRHAPKYTVNEGRTIIAKDVDEVKPTPSWEAHRDPVAALGGTPAPAAAAAAASSAGAGAPAAAAAGKAAPVVDEADEEARFLAYIKAHEPTLIKYGATSVADSKEFLLKNHQACFDPNAAGAMLLKMLDYEMTGQRQKMLTMCRQYLMLTNINDIAKASKVDPRAALELFFKKITDPETLTRLQQETQAFADNIIKRAIQKKKEQEEQVTEVEEERELTREERLGPGGLDPVEVFAQLPESMKAAFQAKDMDMLKAAISEMSLEEAKRHMKACRDSGLWTQPEGDDDEDQASSSSSSAAAAEEAVAGAAVPPSAEESRE